MLRLLCLPFGSTCLDAHAGQNQSVLLVSIDGFRWDYFDKAPAPNLLKLAKEGVKARALVPVFPPETFPSHYSMLTGLHPEQHGIVGNVMHDPAISIPFHLRDRTNLMNTNWWLGEPIWITAARQGVKSATCFWPGTDVPIKGTRPTYWLPYDDKMPTEERIEQICKWLSLPEPDRPRFLTLYLGEVDKAGHRFGPDSREVLESVKEADRYIGILLAKLRRFHELNLNLIIVSDHGMAGVSPERSVNLDDFISSDDLLEVRGGELVFIYPKPGREIEVLKSLKNVPHAKFYRKAEIPARLHFRNSKRIAPIIGLVDEGWLVFPKPQLEAWKKTNQKGRHGYDNQYESMHGIFIANGPGLGIGVEVPHFLNLHVYSLVNRLLGIEPALNEGDEQLVTTLIRQ